MPTVPCASAHDSVKGASAFQKSSPSSARTRPRRPLRSCPGSGRSRPPPRRAPDRMERSLRARAVRQRSSPGSARGSSPRRQHGSPPTPRASPPASAAARGHASPAAPAASAANAPIGEVRGFPRGLVDPVFRQPGPGAVAQPHPDRTRHEQPTVQRAGRMAAAPAQHQRHRGPAAVPRAEADMAEMTTVPVCSGEARPRPERPAGPVLGPLIPGH